MIPGVLEFETKIECKDKCINLTRQQEVIDDETFGDKMNRFLNHLSISNEVDLESWGSEIISKTSNVSPWDYLLSRPRLAWKSAPKRSWTCRRN